MAADLVKRGRNKDALKPGHRVSVSKEFFDINGCMFSEGLPTSIERLYGTVTQVFAVSEKVCVCWDVDGTTTSLRISLEL